MADPRIKQKGQQRGMTNEQLWRERDLIDQINRQGKWLEERLASLEAFIEPMMLIGRPVASGRITTGGGVITINETRNCTVTLTGGNQRVTFADERPRASGSPHYTPVAVPITASGRMYMATNYNTTFFDFVLRNDAGGTIDPAVTGIAMAFVVFDWD